MSRSWPYVRPAMMIDPVDCVAMALPKPLPPVPVIVTKPLVPNDVSSTPSAVNRPTINWSLQHVVRPVNRIRSLLSRKAVVPSSKAPASRTAWPLDPKEVSRVPSVLNRARNRLEEEPSVLSWIMILPLLCRSNA